MSQARLLVALLMLYVSLEPQQAWSQVSPSPAARTPILLDTDIGTDIDDAFALALVLASPELELRGVTTVAGDTRKRAMMVCRFLTSTGRRHTAVAAGAGDQSPMPITSQHQYYYHPDVLFDRTSKPVKEDAVDLLHARLKAAPGKLTIIAAGPLTNLARLLEQKPECKPWIKQVVIVGGRFRDGANPDAGPARGLGRVEVNFASDPKAASAVLRSGVPIVMVPEAAADSLRLTATEVDRVFSPRTSLSLQVQAMYELWNQQGPALTSPLAVALTFDERFATLQDADMLVDERGSVRKGAGKGNVRLVTQVRSDEFRKWFVDRMASIVAPAGKPVKPIAQGGFPNRVHVAEDFDTDIERRWWMAGKEETTNLPAAPAGNRRACRGTLTHDFDDLHGNPKQMLRAVIFNPVPGPPMGKSPRLSFRYFLKGADALRVQIYTLTNGYHRHLIVEGLKQGEWQQATVDMTACRRADGTGGPLSEDERIDDIQFYAEPGVELLIDDIVLFDAAGSDERRPFPRRILFTGNFDTGKQGNEWPGTFAIAEGQGYFWKAARSVPRDAAHKDGPQWLRIHLRGQRMLGASTRLTFRYKLIGTQQARVTLTHVERKQERAVVLKGLKVDAWSEATVDFKDATDLDGRPAPAKKGDEVDAIDFHLAKGGEMLIDDLLLYEPGE